MTTDNYHLYKCAWIFSGEPHQEHMLTRGEVKTLLKKGGWMVRNCYNFDSPEKMKFWYVIKDKFGGMEELSAKMRNQVKRCFRKMRVEKISDERLIQEGYEVYCQACEGYRIKAQPPTRQEFEDRIRYGQENEFWGVFELETDKLVAFCMNLVTEEKADYKTMKAIPEWQQQYAYYGLLYEMNRYYLEERKLKYVTDGTRSVTEHSKIQPFLINKLRFRRAYCQMEMHYVWWLWIVIHLLFPFRKLFPQGGRVRGLLNQESMTRSALPTKRKLKKRTALTAKWIFDRVVALLGIFFFWWFIVLLAILIRIKMPGARAFFCQKRVGQGGRLFTIVKLRTMKAEQQECPITVAGEDRITPFGAKLRRWKLDELPQLWNVLIGDMSFVGPRPDVPGYADQLQGADREVLRLKPGITGPATLKYRDEEELLAQVENPLQYNDEVIFPDKVRLNRYYLHHYSFWTDMRMILATILDQKIEYAGETI